MLKVRNQTAPCKKYGAKQSKKAKVSKRYQQSRLKSDKKVLPKPKSNKKEGGRVASTRIESLFKIKRIVSHGRYRSSKLVVPK